MMRSVTFAKRRFLEKKVIACSPIIFLVGRSPVVIQRHSEWKKTLLFFAVAPEETTKSDDTTI